MADIETINFVEERYKKTASHYANKYELNTNSPDTPCYIEISDESKLFFFWSFHKQLFPEGEICFKNSEISNGKPYKKGIW